MKSYFDEHEIDVIYKLAHDISGLSQEVNQKKDVILQNIYMRMFETKSNNLVHYLNLVENSEAEYSHFVSALTIHTTSWFREIEHFEIIKQDIINQIQKIGERFFNVLSIPCSSGEEVYSLAFVLLEIKEQYPLFDFKIYGCDLDPVSVENANRGIYLKKSLEDIPEKFHKYVKIGQGKTEKYIAIDKKVRALCEFSVSDLREFNSNLIGKKDSSILDQNAKESFYDLIICRNVFIYFTEKQQKLITQKFIDSLHQEGTIILGHSEKIDQKMFHLQHEGNSVYKKLGALSYKDKLIKNNQANIVFFSSIANPNVKKFYDRLLKEFKSVFITNNIQELKNVLEDKVTKIILIDNQIQSQYIETSLLQIKKNQPEIFIALVFFKDDLLLTNNQKNNLNPIFQDFLDWSQYESQISKIMIYIKEVFSLVEDNKKLIQSGPQEVVDRKTLRLEKLKPFFTKFDPKFIAIGSSTGGIEALVELLKNISYKSPPIVIVQHLPSYFSQDFIHRISKAANLNYVSPRLKTKLESGCLYIADGDYHIVVSEEANELFIEANFQPPKNELRPNINILFLSLAKIRVPGIGIILTGMGSDGASGLLALKNSGCLTLTQDEASSVVYGMPKEAQKLGASWYRGNLIELREVLDKILYSLKN